MAKPRLALLTVPPWKHRGSPKNLYKSDGFIHLVLKRKRAPGGRLTCILFLAPARPTILSNSLDFFLQILVQLILSLLKIHSFEQTSFCFFSFVVKRQMATFPPTSSPPVLVTCPRHLSSPPVVSTCPIHLSWPPNIATCPCQLCPNQLYPYLLCPCHLHPDHLSSPPILATCPCHLSSPPVVSTCPIHLSWPPNIATCPCQLCPNQLYPYLLCPCHLHPYHLS